MKAGEIEINILANYQQIEKDLRHVEQQAQQAGDRAGKSFKEEFASKSQMQAEAIIGKFSGIKAAETLVNGITNFIKSDKSIIDATTDTFKGIPWAGSFVGLGEAIFNAVYDNTLGAADAAARQQARFAETEYHEQEELRKAAAEEEAKRLEELKKKRIEDGKIASKQIAEAQRQYYEVGFKDQLSFVEKEGDIEEVRKARILESEYLLRTELQDKLAKSASQKETELLKMTYADKQRLAAEAINKEIDDRIKKETDANKKLADEKAKQEQEIADKLAEEAIKRVEELRDKQAEIESQRVDALTAGVTSANTALGTFTFDAYSDADKKRNDQDSLRQLREINRAMTNLGLT